ncbi:MAG: hypothetical protein DME26_20825 [Verrucomicrobia bacterium]|nr:MAG: hypothetical protein DME26_20825 [Verrucomicrobiota bacterium]
MPPSLAIATATRTQTFCSDGSLRRSFAATRADQARGSLRFSTYKPSNSTRKSVSFRADGIESLDNISECAPLIGEIAERCNEDSENLGLLIHSPVGFTRRSTSATPLVVRRSRKQRHPAE